jgi:hypothetical protein
VGFLLFLIEGGVGIDILNQQKDNLLLKNLIPNENM